MSSDFYKGMISILGTMLTVGVIGLATASFEGAGFQSLDMLSDGGAA